MNEKENSVPPDEATVVSAETSHATQQTVADAMQDYTSLPSFNDFGDLGQDQHYRTLPSDWNVLVADVEQSTVHIENGRYRDINTVGSMCIAVVRNAIDFVHFPYCFGGDGASIVLPGCWTEPAVTALLALKRLVWKNYELRLRVGFVSIGELKQQNATVQVARYEIVSDMTIALFRGGGLALADSIVKGGNELEETEASKTMTPNLAGLSCRWQKIPNRNGCVLTVLVMVNPSLKTESDFYGTIFTTINKILHPDTIADVNPVNLELASYKTAPQMIKDEVRMHKSIWSLAWIARFVEILLCHVLFTWEKLQTGLFDIPEYIQSMRTHADHRKFDDMLRMVLDCTDDQADQIEMYLHSLYDQGGQVFYGTQRSNDTLITCLLEDTMPGKHIHFVDGSSGGYALAAKQLKKQLGTYAESAGKL